MHLPSRPLRRLLRRRRGLRAGRDAQRQYRRPDRRKRRAWPGRRQEYFEERLRGLSRRSGSGWQSATPVGPLHSVGCFGHHTARATDDGAVLVGDAATFINPFTGEGVFFALRGAQLAAEAIDEALATGRRQPPAPCSAYDAARRRELLPRYRLCDAVQRVVHSPALLGWARSACAGRTR